VLSLSGGIVDTHLYFHKTTQSIARSSSGNR
jgi:hypothetical protein